MLHSTDSRSGRLRSFHNSCSCVMLALIEQRQMQSAAIVRASQG